MFLDRSCGKYLFLGCCVFLIIFPFIWHRNSPIFSFLSKNKCSLLTEPFLFISGQSVVSAIFETNQNCPKDFHVTSHWTDTVASRVTLEQHLSTSWYRTNVGSLEQRNLSNRNWCSIFLDGNYFRRFSFFVPSQRKNPIKVGIVSDSHNNTTVFGAILTSLNNKHNVDMVLHAGDIVDRGNHFDHWSKAFQQINSVIPQKIFMFAPGNHDTSHPPVLGKYTEFFSPGYATAQVLSTRFIILDSNNVSTTQLQWVKSQLERKQKSVRFLVVVVHIAPFEEFWLGADDWAILASHWPDDVRLKLVPLFERFGVDLVISGHSHVYQRGMRNGVRYMIVGGAGGGLEDFPRVANWSMYNVSKLEHHYSVMEVTSDSLRIKTYNVSDDDVIDEFEIEKI